MFLSADTLYSFFKNEINYPGSAKWIDMDKFKQGKVLVRRYRNRRIGEFLKEIDLSEKKSTGIFKILRELKKNARINVRINVRIGI